MKCPKCEGPSRVVDSVKNKDHVRRRRECRKCENRFSTKEYLVVTDPATVNREIIAALTQLQEAASDYCLNALAQGTFPTGWPSDMPENRMPPLTRAAKRLVKAINVAKLFKKGDQARESLLMAARATFALWRKHGLGDDENESGQVYQALRDALDAWQE